MKMTDIDRNTRRVCCMFPVSVFVRASKSQIFHWRFCGQQFNALDRFEYTSAEIRWEERWYSSIR